MKSEEEKKEWETYTFTIDDTPIPIEGGISICHDELPTSPEIKKR